ncbi:MAG TPA: lytic transglycosylase domain-containing protein, partial [Terriglobales bacterium]|nr:lytic transglycosylase domain-containing protein [Terriglobales bacterium]
MVAKSIVQVEVQDGQFKEFLELFNKYQKKLDEMPAGWDKVVGKIEDATDPLGLFAEQAGSSQKHLAIAAAQADIIAKAIKGAIAPQDKFNTKVKDGAIQMGRMAKFSKEMHKDISKMSGVLLKLGALGGAAMAIPAAVFASTNAVAGQNLQARGLGLKIGMTQAFGANFERFGLGTSDLGNVANAQSDVSKWRAFMAAGLTPQQIQNEDAEQLTYDFARAASGKFRQWQKAGLPAATMAQAYGFTDVMSLQQLRTGASYDDAKFVSAQAKTLSDAKANEINQGTADQASDVKAALQSDWAKVLNEFNSQLAQASPELKFMGDAASAAAINLLKVAGPEAKKVLDSLEGPPVTRAQAAQGGVVGGLATIGYFLRDKFGMGGDIQNGPNGMDMLAGDVQRRVGTPNYFGDFENQYGLPSGLLARQEWVESRGRIGAVSPKGAKGPFQFMDATAQQYGLSDPYNLHDSAQAAAHMMGDLMRRYNGDIRKALAAYNWGMGNSRDPRLDADIAAHGADWERFAPRQTQDYINSIVGKIRGAQNVNINITNST